MNRWLQRWLFSQPSGLLSIDFFHRPAVTRLRKRRWLRVEPLEERCLLAAVTWDGGAGTLN